jgi:hypothetical protein
MSESKSGSRKGRRRTGGSLNATKKAIVETEEQRLIRQEMKILRDEENRKKKLEQIRNDLLVCYLVFLSFLSRNEG